MEVSHHSVYKLYKILVANRSHSKTRITGSPS
jgi:hypothetical protein